jgi:predicted dehydrogenase
MGLLQAVARQLGQIWTHLSAGHKLILVLLFLACGGAMVGVVYWAGSPDDEILDTGLAATECAEMVRTAQRSSSLLMIGQSYRFNSQYVAVKQAVDGGGVGTPFLVESEYWNNLMGLAGVGNWRMDPKIRHPFVGGCHAMDLIRWVGGEVAEVCAAANHLAFPDQPTDDCIFANVLFEDGCLGRVLVSSGCQRPFQTTLDVHGDRGTIVDGRIIPGKDGKWAPLSLPDLPQPIKGEINAFVESVLDGKPVPVDSKDGYGTMAACFAVVESSTKGKPVKVGRM